MHMRSISLLSLLFSLFVVSARAQEGEAPWEEVGQEAGIKTWKQEVPGEGLPGFRGQAVIDAPIELLREVIDDVEHHTDWMHNCAEARIVKRHSPDRRVVYNRTKAPWPVWDRDVVLDVSFAWSEGGKVLTVSFKDADPNLAKSPAKTVRMPKLTGYYQLKSLAPNKTQVTYQVVADVGGSLPRWLAVRTAKDMPFRTLSRLRERATKIASEKK